jgi:Zn-dependent peptidase ImmA (M78 family)
MSEKRSSFEIVLEYMKGVVPVDLPSLCASLGIRLSYLVMDDEISGEIERLSDGKYAININKEHHPNRQHFTIAHEIGHFIHHRSLIGDGVDDNKMYRSESNGKYFNKNIRLGHEREANTFAASLLMPKEAIIKHVDANDNLENMAELFEVSKAAMKYRLQGLGLTVPEYSFGNIDIQNGL